MAAITIRQLEDSTKTRLRMRAAAHGRSMEAEAREILRQALGVAAEQSLAESIRKRFAPFGGVELNIPKRTSIKPPPSFATEQGRRRGRATAARTGES